VSGCRLDIDKIHKWWWRHDYEVIVILFTSLNKIVLHICKILRLWDVETGKNQATVEARSSVRCCNFSFSGNQAAYSTDKAMGHNCELFVIDSRIIDSSTGSGNPIWRLPMNQSKISAFMWFLDDTIITGHENGLIGSWDLRVRIEYGFVKIFLTPTFSPLDG
jgi:WD40 repeat protein